VVPKFPCAVSGLRFQSICRAEFLGGAFRFGLLRETYRLEPDTRTIIDCEAIPRVSAMECLRLFRVFLAALPSGRDWTLERGSALVSVFLSDIRQLLHLQLVERFSRVLLDLEDFASFVDATLECSSRSPLLFLTDTEYVALPCRLPPFRVHIADVFSINKNYPN